jgi:hypothetical protein
MTWALHVLLTGLAILACAILLNVAAAAAGISTWYDLIGEAREQGLVRAAREAGIATLVLLLVVYPFLLGLAAWLVAWFVGRDATGAP